MPNKIRRYETVIQKGWPFSNVTKFGQRVKSLPYLYCVEKFRLTLEKVVLLIAENSINLSYRKAEKPRNTVFVRLWEILYLSYLVVIYRILMKKWCTNGLKINIICFFQNQTVGVKSIYPQNPGIAKSN